MAGAQASLDHPANHLSLWHKDYNFLINIITIWTGAMPRRKLALRMRTREDFIREDQEGGELCKGVT